MEIILTGEIQNSTEWIKITSTSKEVWGGADCDILHSNFNRM